jgi:DNA-binding NarL/FixJ family response regulator
VVRVLVVDDHPTFRAGLREVLTRAHGIEVVGEAATAEQCLQILADGVDVDVVVMDLLMPGMGGVAATGHITESYPHTRVLVLTMSRTDATVYAALRAGARGYLLKDAEPDEIHAGIHAAAAGRILFGAGIAGQVLASFAGSEVGATPFPGLTPREREVLELLAAGQDNAGIARALRLSAKTVRNHVSAILGKLGADSRAEAIVIARDAGFGRR